MIKKFLNNKKTLFITMIFEVGIALILSFFLTEENFPIAHKILQTVFDVSFFTTYSIYSTKEVCGKNNITFRAFLNCTLQFAVVRAGINVMDGFLYNKRYIIGFLILLVTAFVWALLDVFIIDPIRKENGTYHEKDK